MGTDSCLSPKPNSNVETSSPRESCSSRSFTISLSSENSAAPKTVTRSKSLSNICVDGYTPAELRMIRERLLRFVEKKVKFDRWELRVKWEMYVKKNISFFSHGAHVIFDKVAIYKLE